MIGGHTGKRQSAWSAALHGIPAAGFDPRLARPAHARAPADRRRRLIAAAVAIAGAGLFGGAVAASWTAILAWWATVLIVGASLLVVYPFLLRITAGRDPICLGVAASVLAFTEVRDEPALSLAIWVLGSAVYQAVLRRPLKAALFWTGVSTIAAALFLSTVALLRDLGSPDALNYALGVGLLLAVHIGLSVLHQGLHHIRATDSPQNQIRWNRMGVLWAINIAITWVGAAADAFSDHGYHLVGTSMSAVSVASLEVVCLMVHSLTLRMKLQEIGVKLQVVLDAAHELPWSDVPHPLSRVGTFASVAVPGDAMAIQREPAGANQIGAQFDFPDGRTEHIVVTRAASLGSFSRLEERVLSGLAHMASTTMHVDHGMQRLQAKAATDELTGLANYRAFLDALSLAEAVQDPVSGVAILYIDVDGLKSVNDAYGHDVGNELLVEIAARMRGALRDGDTVARVGGDEFAAILANGITAKDADGIRRRVESEIGRPLRLAGQWFTPSVSIGIAYSSFVDAKIDDLVIASDRDMYKRKMAKEDITSVDGERFTDPLPDPLPDPLATAQSDNAAAYGAAEASRAG
ncbi:diguanylate cyclase domain-containing protein [Pseudarthrobacter sp. P1]|uniref:GGDEF domain-containing protein n=1 Tax=Pseudarthrobacter sp. P1 TaxID=3418418 RepID=UPI003CE9D6A9